MSPRRGGEADKIGNRYEGAWQVACLLNVLYGKFCSAKVEGSAQRGEVDIAIERSDGGREGHQCKRQRGSANNWTVALLDGDGVIEAAVREVAAGVDFHFISMLPAREVAELCEQARSRDDLEGFKAGLNKKLSERFADVRVACGSEEIAWSTLSGSSFRTIDEQHLVDTNRALAGAKIEGGTDAAIAASLRELIVDNLGTTLDAKEIWAKLAGYGLRPASPAAISDARSEVRAQTQRWRASIELELLEPPIERVEANAARAALEDVDKSAVLLTGRGGMGKSAVLGQIVRESQDLGWEVLALRLDRLEASRDSHEISAQVGLPETPAIALESAREGRPGLLLIDQLDAISSVSGRMPESFDAVAEVLREAQAFPEIRALVACRKFDLENDDRLRGLLRQADVAEVGIEPLTIEEAMEALEAMGLDQQDVGETQAELLRLPLNLALLRAIANEAGALQFTSTKQLFDRFWERKRRDAQVRNSGVQFAHCIEALVSAMSSRRRLAVPAAVFDREDLASDAEVLISENVLISERGQVAFFHESFFDYAFARGWSERGMDLVGFLHGGDQELFRRAQVRQVLEHLREEDRHRFNVECRALLQDPGVRFHIKDVVLALLRALVDPREEELALVEVLFAEEHRFAARLGDLTSTTAWFDLLDRTGTLARWLDQDERDQHRALFAMRAALHERPGRVGELLGPHLATGDRADWLDFLMMHAPLAQSRTLFELYLAAATAGQLHEENLWVGAHKLGQEAPAWGTELLRAHFAERPMAMAAEDRELVTLQSEDYSQIELIKECAKGAPDAFLENLLPYLLDAMRVTESESGRQPVKDCFSFRVDRSEVHRAGEVLLQASARALAELAGEEPDRAKPFLDLLAGDPHDSAQWLLYEGMRRNGVVFAERAAKILLQGDHRFEAGYADSSLWTTRELLAAISPHVNEERFRELEEAILSFMPDWESPRRRGSAVFTLLEGLDEKLLSEGGRRRLGELRRRFKGESGEPRGMQFGTVLSPISSDAAAKMSDERWLEAITKHHESERMADSERGLIGGADELSNVLGEEAKADPDRFGKLLLAFDEYANPAYVEAILIALGQGDPKPTPEVIFDAIRHCANLPAASIRRWLPWPLQVVRDAAIPLDILELVIDLALNDPDPEPDAWAEEEGETRKGGRDILTYAMNTVRGAAVRALVGLLAHDGNHVRVALLAPRLGELAADPSPAIRSIKAELLSACLRGAEEEVMAAFPMLADTDPRALATYTFEELTYYVGARDKALAVAVTERLLGSGKEETRAAGGRLAAYLGLDRGEVDLFQGALASEHEAIRCGVAAVSRTRLKTVGKADLAEEALRALFADPDEETRNAAADVVAELRGETLQRYENLLLEVIGSQAFDRALPQLTITLEQAPDTPERVVLSVARKFVEVHAADARGIASRAAIDSQQIGKLLFRLLATASSEQVREEALDLLDELLLIGAYGIDALIAGAER